MAYRLNNVMKGSSYQANLPLQNNSAVQPKKQNYVKNDYHPETAPLFQKTNTGDLQSQMLELQNKYAQLEQSQFKIHQMIKQQSDSLQQQQQNKNDILSSYQITEIKKVVQNILEQNKIPQINQYQQKVLSDLNQLNSIVNKNQQQITSIQEQLKQDIPKQNLRDNNEQIQKQFSQFKDQLISQVQSQFIKIQDELKNSFSQSLQQKMQSIQQQLLKIQDDQKNYMTQGNIQQQQTQQQQAQQQQQQLQLKLQYTQKELNDLKNKVEQMNQYNNQRTIDKKALDILTKQEVMYHQNNPLNSKDLGSSSKEMGNTIKEFGNSIKDMGYSGVPEKVSKLLVSAHKSPEQRKSPERTQFSSIGITKKQQSIQKQQSEKQKVDTDASNCSSLHEINFTCYLCQIQTTENIHQTSCHHTYHNNCYRKLLEKQISQQNGFVKCVCSSVLLQRDILQDLRENYFKMQELFYCKKYSDFMKKCKNFEKCKQFWVNDNTTSTDLCPDCNDKTQNIKQSNYLKNYQQSQQQPSQLNQQQWQKQQYQPPQQQNLYQQQQKQIFSQDQQQQKLGNSQQFKSQHPGIKILAYTGPNQRQ